MRDLDIDLASFSIIDLIESPVQELSNIFGSLTEEQRKHKHPRSQHQCVDCKKYKDHTAYSLQRWKSRNTAKKGARCNACEQQKTGNQTRAMRMEHQFEEWFLPPRARGCNRLAH